MGSGGSKTHEAFSVAPVSDSGPATSSGSPADGAMGHWESTYEQVVHVMGGVLGSAEYPEFVAAVHDTQEAIAESGLPPQVAVDANDQLHADAKQWLVGLNEGQLTDLATEHGLDHAQFVSQKAMMAWLDPSVDDQAKHKIYQLAQQHHDEMVAAGTVSVLAPAEVPDGCWEATPAQIVEAQSKFTIAYVTAADSGLSDVGLFEAAVSAETKLATAHCPQEPEAAESATAAAAIAVDKLVHVRGYAAREWVKKQEADGNLPVDVLTRLSVVDATRLARASTSTEDRAALQAKDQTRGDQVDKDTMALASLTALHPGDDLSVAPVMSSSADVTAYVSAMGDYHAAHTAVLAWNHPGSVADPKYLPHLPDTGLAAKFRSGAKTVPIGQLRTAANEAGLKMSLAKVANRAQLQNYLLAPVSNDQAGDITAALEAKLKPVAAPTVGPAKPLTLKGPSRPQTAGSGAWAAKHRQLIASLQHHSGTLADLPARPDSAQVAGWAFGAGPSMSLGGAHTKSVHTAPDGTHWMFKPDKHGGARATADATANTILHRVGIPTVPVYQRKLAGKPGTIQPLVTGATQLTDKPQQWSQADVDAIVRYHAAAWVIGDHDAKHDNLLRTPSGGLVPIDHGQAFKFYGRDKLSSSFHPNGSYGAREPVWNSLYRAAKQGKLAPGVAVRPTAAVPVIKAFEAIPDTEYATMVRPAAKAGAGNPNMHWRSAMADRAKAKGAATPTADQIADEFVDHAVKRKRSLRADFAKFFATENLHGADVLQKVA